LCIQLLIYELYVVFSVKIISVERIRRPLNKITYVTITSFKKILTDENTAAVALLNKLKNYASSQSSADIATQQTLVTIQTSNMTILDHTLTIPIC